MKKIEQYYDNTEFNSPHKNVKYFVKKIKTNPSKAIELGCGAGRDTIYLIKNKWNVLAIDRENVEKRIKKRLTIEELERFRFKQQDFENIILEKCNLLVANYSLPFCNKNEFPNLWKKIEDSIIQNRLFCWEFIWCE